MDGSEVAELGALVERARRGDGGRRLARRSLVRGRADVEVVDGGERVVDGRGAALEHGLEVGAVVAHGPVAAVRVVSGSASRSAPAEPRQVLADLRAVGTPGLIGQRSCRKRLRCSPRARPLRASGSSMRGAAATTPGGAVVFSEAVPGLCGPAFRAFSVATPGVYFREGYSLKRWFPLLIQKQHWPTWSGRLLPLLRTGSEEPAAGFVRQG